MHSTSCKDSLCCAGGSTNQRSKQIPWAECLQHCMLLQAGSAAPPEQLQPGMAAEKPAAAAWWKVGLWSAERIPPILFKFSAPPWSHLAAACTLYSVFPLGRLYLKSKSNSEGSDSRGICHVLLSSCWGWWQEGHKILLKRIDFTSCFL